MSCVSGTTTCVPSRGSGRRDDCWHRNGLSVAAGFEPLLKRGDDGVNYTDGFGYSDADVSAIPYGADWLNGYHRLMLDETLDWLTTGAVGLSRTISLPGRADPITGGQILDHLILHSACHIGELQMTQSILRVRNEIES